MPLKMPLPSFTASIMEVALVFFVLADIME